MVVFKNRLKCNIMLSVYKGSCDYLNCFIEGK